MEGGGPSSVLQCKSIVKSIALIDDLLICGLDNGSIELFQWESGLQQCLFPLYELQATNETSKHTVNDYQVIHLCVIDTTQRVIIAQCRNGDLFSVDFSQAAKPVILALIRTGIESFVKIGCINTLTLNDKSAKKLIATSDKENELFLIDLNDNYRKASTYSLSLSNPKVKEGGEDEDEETIIPNNSLINCILAKNENQFIALSFESCLIELTTFDFKLITFLHLNEGKTAEPIITMNSFIIKGTIYIAIGLFSTKGVILQYINSHLSIAHIIPNLCSDLRCGISSIDYSQVIKQDLLSLDTEDTKRTDLLCFGGYDHRVKFFDITLQASSLQLKPMGNLILPNHKIINQIILSSNKEHSFYLFVASDQRLLYIYLIA